MNLVTTLLIAGTMIQAATPDSEPSAQPAPDSEPRSVKVRFAPLEVPQSKQNPKAAMREARNVGYLEGREHPPLYLRPLPDGSYVIEHYTPPALPNSDEAPK